MIFKISLKVIIIFAIRTSVGVSNITGYTEYVFGNFLHSCILNCVKLILFLTYTVSYLYCYCGSIEIQKLLLESSYPRGSFIILHYVD